MQLELTPDERKSSDDLMRRHWSQPEAQREAQKSSPLKTIVIWVLLIAGFIGFYQFFQYHDERPPPPVEPVPPAITGPLEWALRALFAASVTAMVWVLRIWQRPQPTSKTVGVDVTTDGVEVRAVKYTSIYPWAVITDVLEDTSTLIVRLKSKRALVFPKRFFEAERRDEVLRDVGNRSSARVADGVDATKYEMTLTPEQARAWKRHANVKVRRQWKIFGAGLVVAPLSSALLGWRDHGAWWLLFGIVVFFEFFFVQALWRARRRTNHSWAFQVGDGGMRWVTAEGGTQLTWEQIDGFRDVGELLLIRSRAGFSAIVPSALPGPLYRSIRERLPRVPAPG